MEISISFVGRTVIFSETLTTWLHISIETYINQQFQTCSEKLTEKALNNFKFEVQTNNIFFYSVINIFKKFFNLKCWVFNQIRRISFWQDIDGTFKSCKGASLSILIFKLIRYTDVGYYHKNMLRYEKTSFFKHSIFDSINR